LNQRRSHFSDPFLFTTVIEFDMDSLGELLTHRSIRLALACIVGTYAIRIANREHWGRDTKFSRAMWTLGCGFFIAHLLFAFHFYHHWSPAHALRVTAERTYKQLGFAFGEGIYFSYLFGLLWLAEVAAMWAWPKWYDHRPKWLFWSVAGFMAFIAFNGAVVFEDGITRPLGIAATLGLTSLGFFAWQEQVRQKVLPPSKEPESATSALPSVSHGVEGDGPEAALDDSASSVAGEGSAPERATGTNSD
jgi:hypothetical protein